MPTYTRICFGELEREREKEFVFLNLFSSVYSHFPYIHIVLRQVEDFRIYHRVAAEFYE